MNYIRNEKLSIAIYLKVVITVEMKNKPVEETLAQLLSDCCPLYLHGSLAISEECTRDKL
jgi:hypothetical protein